MGPLILPSLLPCLLTPTPPCWLPKIPSFPPISSPYPSLFCPHTLSLPFSLLLPFLHLLLSGEEMTVNPWLNYNLTIHPNFTLTGFSFTLRRPVVNLSFSLRSFVFVNVTQPFSTSPLSPVVWVFLVTLSFPLFSVFLFAFLFCCLTSFSFFILFSLIFEKKNPFFPPPSHGAAQALRPQKTSSAQHTQPHQHKSHTRTCAHARRRALGANGLCSLHTATSYREPLIWFF